MSIATPNDIIKKLLGASEELHLFAVNPMVDLTPYHMKEVLDRANDMRSVADWVCYEYGISRETYDGKVRT